MGATHAQKRNRLCEKEKFDLTSTIPLRLRLPVFSDTRIGSVVPWLGGNQLRLLDVDSERPSIRVTQLTSTSLSLRGPFPKVLTFFERGHRPASEGPLFRAFLEPPGMCAFKKAICHIRPNFLTHRNREILLKFKRYLGHLSSFIQEFLCCLPQTQKKPMN